MDADVLARFEAKYEVSEDGCWVWTAAKLPAGYGAMKIGGRKGKVRTAHSLGYEHYKGAVPTGLELDHLCRNRACCNPDHLEAVTHEENVNRGDWPSAVNRRKTHCKQGHEYTEENTHYYGNRRRCRACNRAAMLQRSRTKSSGGNNHG
jgi:hypothetical protein